MRVTTLLACLSAAAFLAGCSDDSDSSTTLDAPDAGHPDGAMPDVGNADADSGTGSDGDASGKDSSPLPDGPTSEYLPGDVLEPWEGGPAYYSKWPNGPSSDPSVFPIAVWLQQPSNLEKFRAVGINLFIGLWEGPTEAQLSALAAGKMQVFCEQNAVGLSSANGGMIRAWTHSDEPDNAQGGTQDPTPTSDILAGYQAMVAADSSRPVYLNFGQGAAADTWYGRGNRTNHPEDYAEYSKGADIVSFDIYPMNVYPYTGDPSKTWFKDFHDAVAQNIWFVAEGVKRLREWTNHDKPVWTWLESTNIDGNSLYALTPTLVKAEAWMALIHGARGLGYFSHTFSPFSETGLLDDPEMRDGVAALNAQVSSLAPVLNTQTVSNGVTVASSNSSVPVSTMVKRAGGYSYVFAVPMRPGDTNATFTLRGFSGAAAIEVIGEGRQLPAAEGVFQDGFSNYAVHLYKVETPGMSGSDGVASNTLMER